MNSNLTPVTRPSLSSEALEEFLSILRFPPQSPTLRARRHPSHNLAFAHDRSHSLSAKPLERLENIPILSPAFGEDARSPGKQIGARITSPSLRPPREEDEENRVTPPPSFRVWANGPLGTYFLSFMLSFNDSYLVSILRLFSITCLPPSNPQSLPARPLLRDQRPRSSPFPYLAVYLTCAACVPVGQYLSVSSPSSASDSKRV